MLLQKITVHLHNLYAPPK